MPRFPAIAAVALLVALFNARLFAAPHLIRVVDDQTGRGVPLVELRTVNKIRQFTDSNGLVAFDEPGLMNRKVYFYISSHGYEYPADAFGYRGAAIDTAEGKVTTLKIHRVNIAERLYRITGGGIYADTLQPGTLANITAPTSQPVLNGGVLGQDTVQTIEYRGRLYWFWGDTDKPGYPLGNFRTTGATSELPGKGGLDPSVGVNLHYFTGSDGECRAMVTGLPSEGPVWVDAMMILKDPAGQERLVCRYVRVKSLAERLGEGLLIWDDKALVFTPLMDYADKDEPLTPAGQPIHLKQGGDEYFYFPIPYAVMRVRADWSAVRDPHQFESFTCLRPGTRYRKGAAELGRDSTGKLVWAWKKDTGPVTEPEQQEMLKAGQITESDCWYRLRDADGKRVQMHAGTVCWNPWRKRWIMIAHQFGGGPSLLGEVWYSEAPDPWGPFDRAVKIVTHNRYTFYNVVQHPQFDQQGGRLVYFEGTYTNSFSGNDDMTPRYDYNQIMYRLDLGDPRLKFAQQ